MKYAAVIASAGLSSRMRAFKPMLCIREKTMIECILENLRAVDVEEIVVVVGYKAHILKEYLKNMNVTICENTDFFNTTMFDSLCLGLRQIKIPYDAVFLTPGDVPLVKRETLLAMLESGAEICRPTCGGKNGHPALFSREYAEKLLSYSGEQGLIGAMRSFGDIMLSVPVDDIGATVDADTPDDFKILRRLDMERRGGGKLWADVNIQIAKADVILNAANAQFLEMIGHTGSIQSACASMHMSYTKGWQLLNKMEADLGYALVERTIGGVSGGGTSLTEQGRQLLDRYLEFFQIVRVFASEKFEELFADDS